MGLLQSQDWPELPEQPTWHLSVVAPAPLEWLELLPDPPLTRRSIGRILEH